MKGIFTFNTRISTRLDIFFKSGMALAANRAYSLSTWKGNIFSIGKILTSFGGRITFIPKPDFDLDPPMATIRPSSLTKTLGFPKRTFRPLRSFTFDERTVLASSEKKSGYNVYNFTEFLLLQLVVDQGTRYPEYRIPELFCNTGTGSEPVWPGLEPARNRHLD